MVHVVRISILCIFVANLSVTLSKEIGDYCGIRRAGRQPGNGRCELLKDCPVALRKLRLYMEFPQPCGFTGIEPIVCCGKVEPIHKADHEKIVFQSRFHQEIESFQNNVGPNTSIMKEQNDLP